MKYIYLGPWEHNIAKNSFARTVLYPKRIAGVPIYAPEIEFNWDEGGYYAYSRNLRKHYYGTIDELKSLIDRELAKVTDSTICGPCKIRFLSQEQFDKLQVLL